MVDRKKPFAMEHGKVMSVVKGNFPSSVLQGSHKSQSLKIKV